MPNPSVTYTFSNGTSADATQVNTNFTDVINGITDGTKDLTILSLTTNGNTVLGSDSSDSLSVNAKAFFGSVVGLHSLGWLSNLSISYSGGTLTMTDPSGSSLSTTNPGYVTVPSTTSGRSVSLKVTAPASFNDDAHASSDLTNFGFGITESAAWGQDMPFFLYVVNRNNSNLDGVDGSSMFFLARSPTMHTTPSAANNIGDTGAIAVTDDQTSILILADVTVANYTSLPCQLIGAIRMQWSSVNTDWTVQSLGNSDGLGAAQLEKTFSRTWLFPQQQNGASSGTHMLPNGGTAPVFTTSNYSYLLDRFGRCTAYIMLTGDGGTDGAGAVDAILSIPYATTQSVDQDMSIFSLSSTGTGNIFWMAFVLASSSRVKFHAPDLTNLTNANLSNGNRWIQGSFTFKAF